MPLGKEVKVMKCEFMGLEQSGTVHVASSSLPVVGQLEYIFFPLMNGIQDIELPIAYYHLSTFCNLLIFFPQSCILHKRTQQGTVGILKTLGLNSDTLVISQVSIFLRVTRTHVVHEYLKVPASESQVSLAYELGVSLSFSVIHFA